MNGVKALSAILIVQILLVVGLTVSGGNQLAVYSSDEPVFTLAVDAISSITIASKDDSLELEKKDGSWMIPSEDAFPADVKKVTEFIEKVTGFKKSWPVATSKSGLKPLKVSDDDFERKITFAGADGELATLILGSSPGFKKVHARAADSNTVYAVELATFELPATADAWTSKEFLYTDEANVEAVELPNVTLERVEDSFVLSDLQENEEMVEKEVTSLLSQVTKPRYVKVLGTEKPQGYDELEKEVRFALKGKGEVEGKDFLAKGVVEEHFYILKEKSQPYYFRVSKGIFDRLLGATRETLVSVKPEEPAAEASDESSDVSAAERTE
jgi:hypothetical protein